MAAELGLGVADKPDSADICFVPGGDYRELLRARGVTSQAGAIVGGDGEELGRHEGIAGFTVGQRRGLGIATPGRRYVTSIDADAGVVTVGSADDLLTSSLEASAPSWVGEPPQPGEPLLARARYHGEPVPGAESSTVPGTPSAWSSKAPCARPRPARRSSSIARRRATATKWWVGA